MSFFENVDLVFLFRSVKLRIPFFFFFVMGHVYMITIRPLVRATNGEAIIADTTLSFPICPYHVFP